MLFSWFLKKLEFAFTQKLKKSKEKKAQNIKAYRKSVKKEHAVNKCLLILDLNNSYILFQRRAFYIQKTLESSCVRRETVDIGRENKEVEPAEQVQMKIYQSNTDRKDLSGLYFNDEPRVHERQQGKNQKSCISIFVTYPAVLSSN